MPLVPNQNTAKQIDEALMLELAEMAEPDTNRLRQLSYVGSSRAKPHLLTMRRSPR